MSSKFTFASAASKRPSFVITRGLISIIEQSRDEKTFKRFASKPEKARDYWRNKIDGYVEIYLKCSLDECIKRDNKKIYNSSSIDESNSQNVVGIDIEFEEPKYSDIVLNAEINSSNQLLKKLIKLIKI